MNYSEWLAEYCIIMEWLTETFRIDYEIWIRGYNVGGAKKYGEFSDSQLLLIRNHLHAQYGKQFNKLHTEYKKWTVKN